MNKIIDQEDYTLTVIKTHEPITNVWHIQFLSASVHDTKFEIFLTDSELEHLKRIL
jgi:hypothetical protein